MSVRPLLETAQETEWGSSSKRWLSSSRTIPTTYRAGRYAIRTSYYHSRVPKTIVFPERLFMRLIKGSLAGLVLTGILAIVPAAAFAHGGGGGGEASVTALAGEVRDTLLSGVVMHLADSQAVALVRDSGGCALSRRGDYLADRRSDRPGRLPRNSRVPSGTGVARDRTD